MSEEQDETTLEAKETHQNATSQLQNIAFDHPEVTQRIKEFYRDLTALDNILCNMFGATSFHPNKCSRYM